MTPNPTVVKCLACGSELKLFVPGHWRMGSALLFSFFTTATVWPSRPPVLLGMAVVVVMAWFWVVASERVYYSWWLWRHPTRCGGDHAHPATAPDAT